MIVFLPFVPWIFDNIILAPTNQDFPLYRFLGAFGDSIPGYPSDTVTDFTVTIINYQLANQFFTHMSVAMWLAILLTVPYILYEIWRFICPALYDNERHALRATFLFGSIMFYAGCAVGYWLIFPLTLRFLFTYQLSPAIINQLSLESYMDNFMMLVLVMGLVFELPLVSAILARVGLLTRSFFQRYRRHAIVILLTAAAIITPTTDPFTLFAVFIPIYLLWELSAFLVPKEQKATE
jgi:sec-independent protein translocase protein TatC